MKRKIIILISLFAVSVLYCASGKQINRDYVNNFEIPKMALKLLTESTVESCRICADDDRRHAFNILNRDFPPGIKLISGDNFNFVRNKECSENEILVSLYTEREHYIIESEKLEQLFPLMVFKFHTNSNHLVGIDSKDFTDNKTASIINKFNNNQTFKAIIEIIPFAYGEGITSTFIPSENKLYIHCKILELQ